MPSSEETVRHPDTFHYIWEGCDIPEKFIPTIMKTAAMAQAGGYRLKLWVDNPAHYYNTLRKFAEIEEIPGLELCDLNSLDAVIEENFDAEKAREIKQILAEESVGGKNMAALSDIQRLLILLNEGGTYCDLDNIIGVEQNDNLNDVTGFEPIHSKHGFILAALSGGRVQNSLLTAAPQNPIIKQLLLNSILAYRRLTDEKIKTRKKHGIEFTPSRVDQKRNPDSGSVGRMLKNLSTQEATGPGLFKKTIREYGHEHGIMFNELVQNIPGLGDYKIMSDTSWLDADKKYGDTGKRSYDTLNMAQEAQPRTSSPLSISERRDILERHPHIFTKSQSSIGSEETDEESYSDEDSQGLAITGTPLEDGPSFVKKTARPTRREPLLSKQESDAIIETVLKEELREIVQAYQVHIKKLSPRTVATSAARFFKSKPGYTKRQKLEAVRALKDGLVKEEHREVLKAGKLGQALDAYASKQGYDSLDAFLDEEIQQAKEIEPRGP